jgi:hypothetical protein
MTAHPVSYDSFRIEVAEKWSAGVLEDDTSKYLSIKAPTRDSELRLTTSQNQRTAAKDWVEFVGQMEHQKGRLVKAVRVGAFRGFLTEFESGCDWIRGWALQTEGVPLSICYRCKAEIRGRDDALVASMIATLNRASSNPP